MAPFVSCPRDDAWWRQRGLVGGEAGASGCLVGCGAGVPGSLPGKPLKNGSPGPSLACAVIVKRVDERTRAKTSINELLRD